jgi:hypothetical protein
MEFILNRNIPPSTQHNLELVGGRDTVADRSGEQIAAPRRS